MHTYHKPCALAGSAFFLSTLAVGCVSKTEKMKAIANGVLGGISGSQSHFVAEADTICSEFPNAKTQVVPSLDKTCANGCRCAPAKSNSKDTDSRTTYDCEQWNAPEWQSIKFTGMYRLDGKPSPTVYFHHQVSWHRTDRGCQLDFTVHGDLDEDGIYSTYKSTIETTQDGAIGTLPDETLLWE